MIKKKRKYVSKNAGIRITRSVRKKGNTSLVIGVVIMFITAIIFVNLGLGAEKNAKPIYEYKIERNANYEVLLKENDLYDTKTLPADLCYASKSIDAFTINFEYNFKGNDKIDTEYNYNITANLVGTVKDEYEDKEVWNKSFTILKNKSNQQVATEAFSIQEKIKLDYDKYDDLVNLYEMRYGIKIDAVLKVRFNIAYQPILLSDSISTEKVEDFIELDIPINHSVTEVSRNYENENTANIAPPIEKIRIREYSYYTIAGLLLIAAFTISIIKMSNNKMSPQEKYEKNVNHILKYYKDIIVTVNNEPNLAGLKMMELISLDDLIDVAEQNHCNIIHYEDLSNRMNYLYAIVGEYVYCYKIKRNEY